MISREDSMCTMLNRYPNYDAISCYGNLLVMLVIEPEAKPITGFSAIFNQSSIADSLSCKLQEFAVMFYYTAYKKHVRVDFKYIVRVDFKYIYFI